MNEIWNLLRDNQRALQVAGAIAVGATAIFWWRTTRTRKVLVKKNFKRDMVYLYQFPSLETIPSMSPFALKVESWLRVNEIPYEDSRGYTWSTAGLLPFIEFNGQEIKDSNVIITKLTEHFRKHENQLSTYDRGVTRAVCMMLDQQTVLSYVYYRYCVAINSFMEAWVSIKGVMKLILRNRMPVWWKRRCYYQSIGRLPESEIFQIGFQDLKALSEILGDKEFLHGDSPTLVDCCAFSHLAQLLYIPLVDYPHTKYIRVNCPNLVEYAERFKQRVWPDWDRICKEQCQK